MIESLIIVASYIHTLHFSFSFEKASLRLRIAQIKIISKLTILYRRKEIEMCRKEIEMPEGRKEGRNRDCQREINRDYEAHAKYRSPK